MIRPATEAHGPSDYRGEMYVGGRKVWWTGVVAIGLRYEPNNTGALSLSAERVQDALKEKKQ